MLPLFIIVPLLGLIAVNLPVGKVTGRLAVLVGLLLSAAQTVLAIWHPQAVFTEGGVPGLSFHLAADPLSQILLLTIGLVAFAAVLVARSTLKESRDLFHFMCLLMVALIGMNGMCLVRDLFSLYVFLEIVAVASFILIAMKRGKDSLEGAFKYIVLSAAASAMMLLAISLLLMTTGSTQFKDIADSLAGGPNSLLAKIAVGAFLCGVLIKGGVVPFHGWVLGAYATGPTATSVLMAGIVSKVAGIYALIRLVAPLPLAGPDSAVVSIFGAGAAMNHVLLLLGIASAIIGALAALGQIDMKRLLAYSSISQVGYILLGIGCGSTLGLIGAIFHFFNHAVFKSLLFVNSAALEERAGTTDMTKMGGFGAKMPWTSTTSALGAMSIAGIPPFAGFWSKLLIILALWQAGFLTYAILAVLVSVLTLAYMLMMQRKIFFGLPGETAQNVVEASPGLVFPAVILAGITVGVGAAVPFVPYIMDAVAAVFKGAP